jgi:hypothetical protein
VVLTDLLPEGITPTGQQLWQLGAVAPGIRRTIVLTAGVNSTRAPDRPLTNTAWIETATPESDNENNMATATVQQTETADLSVAKSVQLARAPWWKLVEYREGRQVVCALTVVNHGPDTAVEVRVMDLLPAGMMYLSDDAGRACNHHTGWWQIGNLALNEPVSLHITATIGTNTSGTPIRNTTVVRTTGTVDLVPADDLSSVVIVIQGLAPPLSLPVMMNSQATET